MNRHHVRRLVALAVTTGMVLSASIALSTNVGASGGSQVSCSKLKGSASTQSLSHCSGPASVFVGQKAGKGTGSSVLTSAPAGYQEGSVTTWGPNGSGGTTTSGVNITLVVGGACKPGSTKEDTITETGQVVSGTGAAAALVGDSLSGTVCYKPSTGAVKNLKGTTLNS